MIHGPFVPAWATYLRDALTMIDIMEAVDKTGVYVFCKRRGIVDMIPACCKSVKSASES